MNKQQAMNDVENTKNAIEALKQDIADFISVLNASRNIDEVNDLYNQLSDRNNLLVIHLTEIANTYSNYTTESFFLELYKVALETKQLLDEAGTKVGEVFPNISETDRTEKNNNNNTNDDFENVVSDKIRNINDEIVAANAKLDQISPNAPDSETFYKEVQTTLSTLGQKRLALSKYLENNTNYRSDEEYEDRSSIPSIYIDYKKLKNSFNALEDAFNEATDKLYGKNGEEKKASKLKEKSAPLNVPTKEECERYFSDLITRFEEIKKIADSDELGTKQQEFQAFIVLLNEWDAHFTYSPSEADKLKQDFLKYIPHQYAKCQNENAVNKLTTQFREGIPYQFLERILFISDDSKTVSQETKKAKEARIKKLKESLSENSNDNNQVVEKSVPQLEKILALFKSIDAKKGTPNPSMLKDVTSILDDLPIEDIDAFNKQLQAAILKENQLTHTEFIAAKDEALKQAKDFPDELLKTQFVVVAVLVKYQEKIFNLYQSLSINAGQHNIPANNNDTKTDPSAALINHINNLLQRDEINEPLSFRMVIDEIKNSSQRVRASVGSINLSEANKSIVGDKQLKNDVVFIISKYLEGIDLTNTSAEAFLEKIRDSFVSPLTAEWDTNQNDTKERISSYLADGIINYFSKKFVDQRPGENLSGIDLLPKGFTQQQPGTLTREELLGSSSGFDDMIKDAGEKYDKAREEKRLTQLNAGEKTQPQPADIKQTISPTTTTSLQSKIDSLNNTLTKLEVEDAKKQLAKNSNNNNQSKTSPTTTSTATNTNATVTPISSIKAPASTELKYSIVRAVSYALESRRDIYDRLTNILKDPDRLKDKNTKDEEGTALAKVSHDRNSWNTKGKDVSTWPILRYNRWKFRYELTRNGDPIERHKIFEDTKPLETLTTFEPVTFSGCKISIQKDLEFLCIKKDDEGKFDEKGNFVEEKDDKYKQFLTNIKSFRKLEDETEKHNEKLKEKITEWNNTKKDSWQGLLNCKKFLSDLSAEQKKFQDNLTKLEQLLKQLNKNENPNEKIETFYDSIPKPLLPAKEDKLASPYFVAQGAVELANECYKEIQKTVTGNKSPSESNDQTYKSYKNLQENILATREKIKELEKQIKFQQQTVTDFLTSAFTEFDKGLNAFLEKYVALSAHDKDKFINENPINRFVENNQNLMDELGATNKKKQERAIEKLGALIEQEDLNTEFDEWKKTANNKITVSQDELLTRDDLLTQLKNLDLASLKKNQAPKLFAEIDTKIKEIEKHKKDIETQQTQATTEFEKLSNFIKEPTDFADRSQNTAKLNAQQRYEEYKKYTSAYTDAVNNFLQISGLQSNDNNALQDYLLTRFLKTAGLNLVNELINETKIINAVITIENGGTKKYFELMKAIENFKAEMKAQKFDDLATSAENLATENLKSYTNLEKGIGTLTQSALGLIKEYQQYYIDLQKSFDIHFQGLTNATTKFDAINTQLIELEKSFLTQVIALDDAKKSFSEIKNEVRTLTENFSTLLQLTNIPWNEKFAAKPEIQEFLNQIKPKIQHQTKLATENLELVETTSKRIEAFIAYKEVLEKVDNSFRKAATPLLNELFALKSRSLDINNHDEKTSAIRSELNRLGREEFAPLIQRAKEKIIILRGEEYKDFQNEDSIQKALNTFEKNVTGLITIFNKEQDVIETNLKDLDAYRELNKVFQDFQTYEQASDAHLGEAVKALHEFMEQEIQSVNVKALPTLSEFKSELPQLAEEKEKVTPIPTSSVEKKKGLFKISIPEWVPLFGQKEKIAPQAIPTTIPEHQKITSFTDKKDSVKRETALKRIEILRDKIKPFNDRAKALIDADDASRKIAPELGNAMVVLYEKAGKIHKDIHEHKEVTPDLEKIYTHVKTAMDSFQTVTKGLEVAKKTFIAINAAAEKIIAQRESGKSTIQDAFSKSITLINNFSQWKEHLLESTNLAKNTIKEEKNSAKEIPPKHKINYDGYFDRLLKDLTVRSSEIEGYKLEKLQDFWQGYFNAIETNLEGVAAQIMGNMRDLSEREASIATLNLEDLKKLQAEITTLRDGAKIIAQQIQQQKQNAFITKEVVVAPVELDRGARDAVVLCNSTYNDLFLHYPKNIEAIAQKVGKAITAKLLKDSPNPKKPAAHQKTSDELNAGSTGANITVTVNRPPVNDSKLSLLGGEEKLSGSDITGGITGIEGTSLLSEDNKNINSDTEQGGNVLSTETIIKTNSPQKKPIPTVDRVIGVNSAVREELSDEEIENESEDDAGTTSVEVGEEQQAGLEELYKLKLFDTFKDLDKADRLKPERIADYQPHYSKIPYPAKSENLALGFSYRGEPLTGYGPEELAKLTSTGLVETTSTGYSYTARYDKNKIFSIVITEDDMPKISSDDNDAYQQRCMKHMMYAVAKTVTTGTNVHFFDEGTDKDPMMIAAGIWYAKQLCRAGLPQLTISYGNNRDPSVCNTNKTLKKINSNELAGNSLEDILRDLKVEISKEQLEQVKAFRKEITTNATGSDAFRSKLKQESFFKKVQAKYHNKQQSPSFDQQQSIKNAGANKSASSNVSDDDANAVNAASSKIPPKEKSFLEKGMGQSTTSNPQNNTNKLSLKNKGEKQLTGKEPPIRDSNYKKKTSDSLIDTTTSLFDINSKSIK